MNTTHHHFRWPLVALWIALSVAMLGFATSLKAQTGPRLTLISPKDGDTVDGPVIIRVQHSGIRFDGTLVSKDPVPGVGHYHINVDGKYAGLSDSNVIEIPNDAMPTIKAGPHTVMLNLHENNHASTNPPVEHSFQIVATKDI